MVLAIAAGATGAPGTSAPAAAPPAAAAPCPPTADSLVAAAWAAYRRGDVRGAGRDFARVARDCPRYLDAVVGLGYVALRDAEPKRADSLFARALARDSALGDAWAGRALAAERLGDAPRAIDAARRAVRLAPADPTPRELLDRLAPEWDRPAPAAPARARTLQLAARTRGERFEVLRQGHWQPFYIQGVNLGVALPGRFPSEFPPDSARYAGWLDTLATMGANTVRLYTILPPAFYRALRGWNRTHPGRELWLVHGVWTELPPGDDFDDRAWKEDFRAEMRRVVDLLHGAAEIPPRPGHARGRYDADVSPWTLGYIIGREWEPYAVKAFDERRPGMRPWRGRFLETLPAPAMDRWMAEQCDYLLAYEVDRYNALRPIAYTNWPTLDPLVHPTEATAAEEAEWRRRLGRPSERATLEYENDAIGLDAMLVRPTAANPAGWFASYHAYPYYPDFMLYDPGYDRAASSEGRSNYFGYLADLRRHHAGVPLVIAEYGVPSSRGMAHLQPQGWHHGGHDEAAMAAIDARLTREIRESGAAGAILFAWIDEWFKKNWIVIDFEIPLENTRQWHNVMDAEQNYGILGMYAGRADTRPEPGGDPARWRRGTAALRAAPGDGTLRPGAVHVGGDASYVYVAVEFPGLAGRPFPWDSAGVLLALDTFRRDLGQRVLPGGVLRSGAGLEFVADFRTPRDAQLLVTPDYNRHGTLAPGANGDDAGRFYRRPVTTRARADGAWDSLFVVTNRARFTRDGRFIPAAGHDRGRLRFGTTRESSLADWYFDQRAGLLQLRLPWDLLNVSDPSTRTLLYETTPTGDFGTARADGFRLGVVTYAKGSPRRAIAALPAAVGGEWPPDAMLAWTWEGWQQPTWHQKLKPVYDSLKALWTR